MDVYTGIAYLVSVCFLHFKVVIHPLSIMYITETKTRVPHGFNSMSCLIFFDNLSHKIMNYQFCIFKVTHPFLCIMS